MMDEDNEYYKKWGDRPTYLMVLICQFIGVYMSTGLASNALIQGGMGSMILNGLVFFLLGMPIFYMEMVVGQFTGRDCIDVWRVRPFLSHVGYFLVAWQIIVLLCNHIYCSFVLHYFIISFENPIPFTWCSHLWSDKRCNIARNNYTVNKECVSGRAQTRPDFCANVKVTYPESQYWKNYVLHWPPFKSFWSTISWRAIVASAIICIVLYVCCYKRKIISHWFLYTLTFFPFCGYLIIMFGSMVQKGVVANFPQAIDFNFKFFFEKTTPLVTVKHMIYALNLGSGVTMNVAGNGGFRAPVYANAVLPVCGAVTFLVLLINVQALASCPYAFEHNTHPYDIIGLNLLTLFEKFPRLFHVFSHSKYWLLMIYSANVVISLRMAIIMFHNLQELAASRSATLAHYPGLSCLGAVILLFLGTGPLMNHIGMNILVMSTRRYLSIVGLFVTILEFSVFILWYGIGRFTEDIHFMQGVKPNFFFRFVWTVAVGFLMYIFVYDMRYHLNSSIVLIDQIGLVLVFLFISGIVGLAVVRLAVAWWLGRLQEAIQLDPAWGPRSELLRRSRAMFTAQAMTKEYLYRQYHLQAGVAARQRRSNVRASSRFYNERRTTLI